MDITAVTALFVDLPQVELTTWVERGWVLPDTAEAGFEFREAGGGDGGNGHREPSGAIRPSRFLWTESSVIGWPTHPNDSRTSRKSSFASSC